MNLPLEKTSPSVNPLPVVLLSGLLLDERMWQPQREALSDVAVFHVPDLTRADSFPELARQVLETAPDRFALAGLSMGGALAFEVWRQAPDRVTHLALLDANPHADTPERKEDRHRQLEMADRGQFAEITTEVLLPRLLHPDRLSQADLTALILDMALTVGPVGFRRQIEALMSRVSSLSTLPAITVPTLVLCGREDRLTPLALHEEMVAHLPNAELVVVEHCGHLSTLEQPDAVNAALRHWLSRDPGK